MHSSLRSRSEECPDQGQKAISEYLEWRRRHFLRRDERGRAAGDRVPGQRKGAGFPGRNPE